MHVQMRKPYQSPGRMNNSSYYIAPAGDRTHDLPHTVASNMVVPRPYPLGHGVIIRQTDAMVIATLLLGLIISSLMTFVTYGAK